MFSPKCRHLGRRGGVLLLCFAVVVGYVSFTSVQLGAAQQADDKKAAEQMTALLKKRVALAHKTYDALAQSFGEVKRIGGQIILLTKPDAEALVAALESAVRDRWYEIARVSGVTVQECELISGAFVYPGFRFRTATV